jgi:hypothetical protein
MKTLLKRALVAAVVIAGCVDPAARLDEFYANSEPLRVKVVVGPCAGQNDISGEFLLAIATVIRPPAPILLAATFTIDSSASPWTIEIAMTPLAVEGRAPVGNALVASGTVAADGTFDLDFGEIHVPGAANPIIPGVDATATLLLSGCTNGTGFSCGTIDGAITSPAELPLTGSTYAAIAVEGDELQTAEPVAACPE